jgi:acylpyruvate hydrolase
MLFSIPKLIEYVSSVMTLREGDIILTGTPEGVGPVNPGQILEGSLLVAGSDKYLASMKFPVINRK